MRWRIGGEIFGEWRFVELVSFFFGGLLKALLEVFLSFFFGRKNQQLYTNIIGCRFMAFFLCQNILIPWSWERRASHLRPVSCDQFLHDSDMTPYDPYTL